MDFQKDELFTVIRFGTLDQFKEKLVIGNKANLDVINAVDKSGISLLGRALASRKFDIVNYLLENGVKINQVSYEGFNELHLLAANINFSGAVDVARVLIDKGIDLDCIDRKYGNTAFLTLCLEIFKQRTDTGMKLIEDVLRKNPNIDICNKAGISARSVLMERGPDEIRYIVEEI
jgi:ankyrin repeat protein